MKRIFLILFAIGLASTTAMAAMSMNRVREDTRFLTDKMAYELRLSTPQYNDVYEINYDFVYAIGDLMQYVVQGDEWALNDYYEALDIRNDDLRWVLSESQYRRFLGRDYFYRPISATGRGWSFRIYVNYTNRNQFYFGRPYHYQSYCGGHYRRHYHTVSYYRDRHTRFNHYARPYRGRDNSSYNSHRRSDFGSITMRPSSSIRPGNSVTRPGSTVTRPVPDRGNGSRNETPARPNRDTDRRPDSGSNSGRRPSTDRNNSTNRREPSSDRRSERSTSTRNEVSPNRRAERSPSSESSKRSGRDNGNSSSHSSERGNSGRR